MENTHGHLGVNMMEIKLKDFSIAPAGRMRDNGPNSGERFREDVLYPALLRLTEGQILVDISGVLGLGSSFLEEAFGGLVRVHHFSADDLRKKLKVISDVEFFVTKIWEYIDTENKKLKA
jgi:hypothetical protein